MNKPRPVPRALRRARGLRLAMLSLPVKLEHDGLRGVVKQATNGRTHSELLRDLADHGPKTNAEHWFLSHLLRAIAAGRDVRKELDVPKIGHRPRSPTAAVIIAEIRARIDEEGGRRGADAAAIREVAILVGKEEPAVKKVWQRRGDKR